MTGNTRIVITVAVTTGYDPIDEELPVIVRVVTLVVVCVMVRGKKTEPKANPSKRRTAIPEIVDLFNVAFA
jgi:hypothetical protein